MANLTSDQASIVLTPTAYDNGKVLCAKPSEPPYGDFDFSRNSAATRVNAQGLVENVQILSSNLVQNGDFSEEGAEEVSNGSFSQEGVEQVTNGDFATDSDWNKSASATISSGVATLTANASNVFIYQTLWVANAFTNKTVKVTYTIISNTLDAGKFTINGLGGNDFSLEVVVPQTVGTHSVYIPVLDRAGSDNRFAFLLNSEATSGSISIDNCSVREVGQDWILGTGWSIGEDKAVADGSNAAVSGWLRQSNVLTVGKTYTFSCSVETSDTGLVGEVNDTYEKFLEIDNGSGEYTTTFTAIGPGLAISQRAGKSFSITNISVKEVGQNWNITNIGAATTNITLGALNIITAGDFTNAQQNGFLTSGNNYRLTYTIISNAVVGVLQATIGTAVVSVTVPSTVGTHSIEFTAAGSAAFAFKRGGGPLDVSITNISVIEITDDTNLPRINYEGFSYQDALGSELNPNTYIAGKSANLTLNGTQLQIDNGGENYARARANVVLVSGKTYRAKVTCINQGTNGASFYVLSARPFGTINMISGETYEVTFVADSFYTPFYENKVGGSGLIVDNISIKEYLGQEVVPDSGCGSWLFEPASTNLCYLNREDFSIDVSWT